MTEEVRSYHHHDLRTALIRHSLDLIAEAGLAGFSVAKVAKRAGVSSGAPYRHFPDRESLLAATAIVFFGELAAGMRAAAETAGTDPVDRFAATAGAYVRHAIAHNVGFDLFTAIGREDERFAAFGACSRELVDFLSSLALEAEPQASWTEIIELLQTHLALSQGFADMHGRGAFSLMKLQPEDYAARAVAAIRQLVRGRALTGN